MGDTPQQTDSTQAAASPALAGMQMAAEYLKTLQPPAQPAKPPSTQGTTTIGPNLKQSQAPTNTRFTGSGLMGILAFAGNKINEHKQREQAKIFDQFTGGVKGIDDAMGQVQEAQQALQSSVAKLKENPQDPEAMSAYQDAAQRAEKAKQALQINRTNVNDLFTGPKAEKNYKTLAKGFGIDDKNAGTPERQQAIGSIKKQLGVGDKAASLISHRPQQAQLTPQAREQQMATQAGVVGKPATQGQQLTHADNAAKLAQQKEIKSVDQFQKQEAIMNKTGLDTQKLVDALPGLGMKEVRDANGQVMRNPDGTLVTRNLTNADVEGNPQLSAKLAQEKAKTNAIVSNAKATSVRAETQRMSEMRKRSEHAEAMNPASVKNWAMLVSDPSSGVDIAKVPSAARSAVIAQVASEGKTLSKPLTSDELKRADLANNAVENIKVAQDILKNRPDMFGPAGWGKTKFEQAVMGGDPDALKFQAAVTLANLPAVGIHGVRGQWAVEDLDKLDGNLYLNPEAMGGVLGQIERSAGEFQKMGGRRQEASSPQVKHDSATHIKVTAEDMK